MDQRKWRIAIDVPSPVRGVLLNLCPPRFTQAYCWSITWAYKVEETFPFNPEVQRCIISGLYTGTAFQSFVVCIGDASHRPDGRLLHLVHTTEPGVQPAHAGLFDPREAYTFDEPVVFSGRLTRFPMWRRPPTTVMVASR